MTFISFAVQFRRVSDVDAVFVHRESVNNILLRMVTQVGHRHCEQGHDCRCVAFTPLMRRATRLVRRQNCSDCSRLLQAVGDATQLDDLVAKGEMCECGIIVVCDCVPPRRESRCCMGAVIYDDMTTNCNKPPKAMKPSTCNVAKFLSPQINCGRVNFICL
jgi:hypothetical protein